MKKSQKTAMVIVAVLVLGAIVFAAFHFGKTSANAVTTVTTKDGETTSPPKTNAAHDQAPPARDRQTKLSTTHKEMHDGIPPINTRAADVEPTPQGKPSTAPLHAPPFPSAATHGTAAVLNPGPQSQDKFAAQFKNQQHYTAEDIKNAYQLGAAQSTYGKNSWKRTRHIGESNDSFRQSCGAVSRGPPMGGCETWFGSNELHAEAVQEAKTAGVM